MLYISKPNEAAPSVTANDPSAVFVVKSLLYPLVVVATLGVSMWWWGEHRRGPYFLLGVLAFITSAEFFDVVPLRGVILSSGGQRLSVAVEVKRLEK